MVSASRCTTGITAPEDSTRSANRSLAGCAAVRRLPLHSATPTHGLTPPENCLDVKRPCNASWSFAADLFSTTTSPRSRTCPHGKPSTRNVWWAERPSLWRNQHDITHRLCPARRQRPATGGPTHPTGSSPAGDRCLYHLE